MINRTWQFSIWKFTFSLLAAGTVGYFLGLPWLFVSIALATYLAWQLRSAYRFHKWLCERNALYPPESYGVWADIQDLTTEKIKYLRSRRRTGLETMREFRRAAAALPDAVIGLDHRNQILWSNRKAEQLLGIRERQDIGAVISNLIRLPAFIDWLQNEEQTPLVTSLPNNHSLILKFYLLEYTETNRLLLARNVTKTEKLNQRRKEFVANASHELRTPLTVINGYLEIMEDDSLKEWEPVISQLREQSMRMKLIVDDLLSLSHLDGAKVDQHFESIQMPALLETLKKEAEALSKGQHIIDLKISSSKNVYGLNVLYNAFSNLISNAVRYTPEGGRISLCWKNTENGAEFSVRDTGIGIPRQHISRLTERFYRADSDRARTSGGTGLGLAIVKHILQKHHAELIIESEVGTGSTFICAFPNRMLHHTDDKLAQTLIG